MRSNRLAGHTLPNEGRINGLSVGYSQCCGPAVCSCGAESEVLHGANARKRWHREHKDKIRAGLGVPDVHP
jgi:hypothetical protein